MTAVDVEPKHDPASSGPLSRDETRIFSKIAWRILPLLVLSYIANFIDRTNVGFAALTMNKAIGLTAEQFGYGAGLLFIGYSVFELPSNMALYKFGARAWLTRIMVTWGFISMATMFAVGANSFYALRFVLGIAEAGFFPGAAFFIAQWFPAQFRAQIYAWFLLGIPISQAISAPLAGPLLAMDGIWGLQGWQWLYIMEGLPAVVMGIALWLFLPNTPEEAGFLTADEKVTVRQRLSAEKKPRERHDLIGALTDIRVLLIALVQFTYTVGSYGVSIFLPLIVKAQNFDNFTVGLLTALPSVAACICMILWARVVDRSDRKLLHLATMCLISGIGLCVAVWTPLFPVALLGLTVVVIGTNAARGVLWTIPTRFLTGAAAAGGLAAINSIGTLGGFVGPSIMGYFRQLTGSFNTGLLALSGFLFVSAMLVGVLSLIMRRS